MSILLGQTACITTTKSEYKHFSEKAGGGGEGGGGSWEIIVCRGGIGISKAYCR